MFEMVLHFWSHIHINDMKSNKYFLLIHVSRRISDAIYQLINCSNIQKINNLNSYLSYDVGKNIPHVSFLSFSNNNDQSNRISCLDCLDGVKFKGRGCFIYAEFG